MVITGVHLLQYELPFKVPVRAGDGQHDVRSGLLLGLVDDSGITGWGEAAPLPGWSGDTFPQAEAGLRGLALTIQERPPAGGASVADGGIMVGSSALCGSGSGHRSTRSRLPGGGRFVGRAPGGRSKPGPRAWPSTPSSSASRLQTSPRPAPERDGTDLVPSS